MIMQLFQLILFCILLMMTSACQLTAKPSSPMLFGNYYLTVKDYSNEQYLQELAWQKQQLAVSPVESAIKLAVLHTLSDQPNYNPYTAKTFLNQVSDEQISAENIAFVTSMRSQLNSLINLLNQEYQSKLQIKQLKQNLNSQTQENKRLHEKIEQLKLLEQTIQQQNL